MSSSEPKGPDGLTDRQRTYAAMRVQGKPIVECKAIAGYGPNRAAKAIEKPGGVVWGAIRKALDEHGMDDDWLAKNLKDGVERAETAITRFNPKTGGEIKDPDLAAKDRFLGRICKIRGYEREQPGTQIAIQVNNEYKDQAEKLADGEAESIINALRAEIGARESADVLEANIVNEDPPAHNGVGGTDADIQETPSGGSQP